MPSPPSATTAGRGSTYERVRHIERTGRKRLQRNVAIAMGNSDEQKFIPQLKTWATADDPILAESAEWAISQINSRASISDNPASQQPHIRLARTRG